MTDSISYVFSDLSHFSESTSQSYRRTDSYKSRLLEYSYFGRRLVSSCQELIYQQGALLSDIEKEALVSLGVGFSEILPWTLEELSGEHTELDQNTADGIAKLLAQSVHLLCHNAFETGIRTVRTPLEDELNEAIAQEEVVYNRLLESSRAHCLQSNAAGLSDVLDQVFEQVVGSLSLTLENSASFGYVYPESRSGYGVRISGIARRYAMLAANLVLLQERLRNKTTIRTTAEIAESRSTLRRLLPAFDFVPESYGPPRDRERIKVIDRLVAIEWIQAPEKPFTEAQTDSRGETVLIPYKRVTSQGCVEGAQFWAKGRVKQGPSNKYFEVEFEGSGNHQMEVWEDWLAYQVRNIYNLYPGSLYMEWEFPEIGSEFDSADYFARINHEELADYSDMEVGE